MTLASGTRLGSYEVMGVLGAGGMGEVYRARDSKLNREVAIKVLPDAFARDEERMKRFEREAHVLASLNHPNIAAIYGIEDTGASRALVLELVDGPTLAERITSGAIPLDESLRIAIQIARGIEAAHERAVIHRDLKPANVKLTKDGDVKILDFGLAKALEAESSPAEESHSPTLTRATEVGVLLGTAAYMSPEQAKGKSADRRADVWAFGVVLYEMLTGRRAFAGEDVSETLAHVLTKEPDWSALPPGLPPWLRALLERCLTKDPKRRLQAIGEARIALEDIDRPIVGAHTGAARSWWRLALAGLGLLALGAALGAFSSRSRSSQAASLRLSVQLGDDSWLVIESFGATAILSPDGQTMVFSTREAGDSHQRLFVRRLDQLNASPIPGTEGAMNPFFSPDGKWLGFFADNKLRKVPVTGGAAVALADALQNRGGSFAEDGSIIFAPTDRTSLFRVPAEGGEAEPVTTLDPVTRELTHRWPQVLPGSKAVLFTSHVRVGNYEDATIVVQELSGGERHLLLRGGYHGRYLLSGHLAYIRDGTLYIGPFDEKQLRMTDQAVPVLTGVLSSVTTAGAQFAFSNDGKLVYVPGATTGGELPIDWLDREGKTSPLRAVPDNYRNLRLSPDGARLAVDIQDGSQRDVWIFDWERDTLSRLTFDPGEDSYPVWTPDGRYVAFSSGSVQPGRVANLYLQSADGTGDAVRLSEGENQQFPSSWHPDGNLLAYFENNRQSSWDILLLPVEGDVASGFKAGAPIVFLNGPASEREAAFSPDGRWIAYQSNESGRYEIYVVPFPASGGKHQVSSDGGSFPTWSRDGRELLFVGAEDKTLLVTPVAVGGNSFRFEQPRPWSAGQLEGRQISRNFDLHPDGLRVAAFTASEERGIATRSRYSDLQLLRLPAPECALSPRKERR